MWEGMTSEAEERLETLGVDTEGLEDVIQAECIRAYNYVTGMCNIEFVPEILKPVCVDMACAAVIEDCAAKGCLIGGEGGRLKSIKEGDVTLGFDQSAAVNAQNLLDRLNFNDKNLVLCYRKLRW